MQRRAFRMGRVTKARASTDGRATDSQAERREATELIVSGVGVGVLGTVAAAISGAVCPVCVVAAPALIGVGAYRRWRASRLRSPEVEQAVSRTVHHAIPGGCRRGADPSK